MSNEPPKVMLDGHPGETTKLALIGFNVLLACLVALSSYEYTKTVGNLEYLISGIAERVRQLELEVAKISAIGRERDRQLFNLEERLARQWEAIRNRGLSKD